MTTDTTEQVALFTPDQLPPEKDALPINGNSSLQAALGQFEQHMRAEGFSINTQKAFASDVRLLGKYLGIGQPVGEIATKNLNDFLHWLTEERGVPCSPKTYARRVTTIKVFFGWLFEKGIIHFNPANAVIQRTVKSPLPVVPTDADLNKALATAQAWREGEGDAKGRPDARPYMLITLLLKTAIKKGEAMGIVPNHIDRDEPEAPILYVRYKSQHMRYKERKLDLDSDWLTVLDEYLDQYQPKDTLFTCTARNLEYVLRDVGEAAGLKPGLMSFENLRWASALHDYRHGVDHDKIRQKLGLSKVTWRETRNKLGKLAEKVG